MMSKFKDMIIDIQTAVLDGNMTFQQIANYYGVPLSFIDEIVAEAAE